MPTSARRNGVSLALAALLAGCGRSSPASPIPATPSWKPVIEFSPGFRYWHLSLEEAKQVYPLEGTDYLYDPLLGFCSQPGQDAHYDLADHAGGYFRMRTNSLSMREDEEPAAQKPDLRVLVTGDSHTDGACDNSESWANRLEALLREARPGRSVEVLNAGTGSYSFYNYLGVLQKYLVLRPDVFVVCVYGGNDWGEVLAPWHLYQGTPRAVGEKDYWERILAAQKVREGWGNNAINQSHNQYIHFQTFPEQVENALRAGLAVMQEIAGLCSRNGVRLVCLYLPPAVDVQYALNAEGFDEVGRALQLDPSALEVTNRLADRFGAALRERGVEFADLRTRFAGQTERLYWNADLHINLRGNDEAARALLPLFDAGR